MHLHKKLNKISITQYTRQNIHCSITANIKKIFLLFLFLFLLFAVVLKFF